jgi:hypothetical protein
VVSGSGSILRLEGKESKREGGRLCDGFIGERDVLEGVGFRRGGNIGRLPEAPCSSGSLAGG